MSAAKSSATRAALMKVTDKIASENAFTSHIACEGRFQPSPGMTVENCLDSSSNLLQGCIHLSQILIDGDPADAEQTGYCLTFLLEGAKSLVDAANSQLLREGKP